MKTVEYSDSGLVAVIVYDSLYPEIQISIDRYVQDLINEGYNTKVITASGGNPEDLRNLLINELPNNLVGAILIGNLPVAWWEESSYGEDYPVDFFFTDLDGNWSDNDGDGIYDSHSSGSGDVLPEIWVGRLYASRLTYGNEAAFINEYFDRNHSYRTGNLTLPFRGLVYNEVTWYPNDHGMGNLYSNVSVINSENTTTAYDYKTRLNQQYQFVHLVAHSSCWAHTFFLQGGAGGGGSVFSFEMPFVDPDAFFYFLNCCMAARYIETNNLANWYLFSRSYSQVVIASSSLMYGINSMDGFYTALSDSISFGEAFKDWYSSNYNYYMGTLMLGDPSLKVMDYTVHVEDDESSYEGKRDMSWSIYQVENSQFVNGHPEVGMADGKIRIFWDSGRNVRSDTYSSYFMGSGFSSPDSIAWHEYYDFFPSVTTDSAGRLWLAWQSFRDYSSYYDHFNVYTCYLDNEIWSSPEHVDPMGGWHDVQPALASCSKSNTVWAAFKSYRDGNSNIYVSHTDNSYNWINSYPVTQTEENETDPDILVDKNDNVWVFWSGIFNGRYHVQGSKYEGSWSNVFTVDSGKTENMAVQSAVDSLNQIWLVWHRFINNQGDIYYTYYNGSQWAEPQPLTGDTTDDILPSITIDSQGNPWVCWMSERNGSWDIYYSCNDGGWNMPQPVTVDTAQDIDPVILADDSMRVWISWASNRNDYWNIYAGCADISSIKEIPDKKKFVVKHAPNPFYDAVMFESDTPFGLEIYDVSGKLIKSYKYVDSKYIWKPENLPCGVYLARVKNKNYIHTLKLIHIK